MPPTEDRTPQDLAITSALEAWQVIESGLTPLLAEAAEGFKDELELLKTSALVFLRRSIDGTVTQEDMDVLRVRAELIATRYLPHAAAVGREAFAKIAEIAANLAAALIRKFVIPF